MVPGGRAVMDAHVIWQGGMSFNGLSDSGFSVPMDAKPAEGGSGNGFKPLELFAVGLAGCTAMDVISILKKKQQKVTAFDVSVHADRALEHPKIFTDIEIVYRITGANVDPVAVERAIQLSSEKYCAAQAMLSKSTRISSRYEIIQE
jgi:putative redox protein